MVIKVFIKEPHKIGYFKEIENTLKAYQAVVEGNIETIPFSGEIIIVCNEEGRIIGLPRNSFGIRGTFFMCKVEDGDFASLIDDHCNHIKKLFGITLNEEFEEALNS